MIAREVMHVLVCHPSQHSLRGGSHLYHVDCGWRLVMQEGGVPPHEYGICSCEVAMASIQIGKQAVVIGAGMAGLTAAAALADHFDNIVILERDGLPSEPMHRAGTPQARHVHGLLF